MLPEIQLHGGRNHVEQRKEAPRRPVVAPKRGNRDGGSRAGSRSVTSGHRTVHVEATAYTAFCDTGCIGVTATGVDVGNTIYHEGKRIIAVDPSVIPLGSAVTLKLADGRAIEATAQDTGGDIRGNRIDLLVGSRDRAFQFGRQSVEVVIHERRR